FISSKGMGVIVPPFDCAPPRGAGEGAARPWRRHNAVVATLTSVSVTTHKKMRQSIPELRFLSDDLLDCIGDPLSRSANKRLKAPRLLPDRELTEDKSGEKSTRREPAAIARELRRTQ